MGRTPLRLRCQRGVRESHLAVGKDGSVGQPVLVVAVPVSDLVEHIVVADDVGSGLLVNSALVGVVERAGGFEVGVNTAAVQRLVVV